MRKKHGSASSSSSGNAALAMTQGEMASNGFGATNSSALKKTNKGDGAGLLGEGLISPAKRTKFQLNKVSKKESNLRFAVEPEVGNLETMKRA